MSKERHPSQTELVVSNQQGLEKRRSGLVKRGLQLAHQIKRPQLRVFLANHDDDINEGILDIVENVCRDKYDLRGTVRHIDTEIFELSLDREFDIFILFLNNIRFFTTKPHNEHRNTMLGFVSHLRALNRKPIIVLYGWPGDLSFAQEAKNYGASFAFQAPCKVQDLREAIERCLGEVSADSPNSISLLLPYYWGVEMTSIYRQLGFRVFWADHSPEITEIVIKDIEPDLAIEWQHGPNDFPIRGLLRKHGRRTPVILALNWGGPLPDDPREIGCAGYWKPSDLRELMGLFYDALPQEKKHILARLCAVAGVELKPVN